MKIGFVTDSTSDIPAALAEQHGIEIVRAVININGKSYTDGLEISREDFYTRLPGLAPLPTTSSPSVGAFQVCYEKLLKAGSDSILSIHPPNELSGIYNAARLAAEEFGQRVKVLDSGQVSLGLGYQVLLAAEAAAKGAIQDEVLIPGGKRTQTRTANGAFGYRRICSSERASRLGGCNDRRGSAAPTIN